MSTIPLRCKYTKLISIEKIKPFQANLKSIDEQDLIKLKRSILKYGFSFPVFVWNGNILDGHTRLNAVKALVEEGYKIKGIPVVEIEAKSKKEAGEKLLLINSKYAKITDEGLYNFVNDFGIDLKDMPEISLPEIKIDSFIENWFKEEVTESTDDMIETLKPNEIISREIKKSVFCRYWGKTYPTRLRTRSCSEATRREDLVKRITRSQELVNEQLMKIDKEKISIKSG